MAFCRFSLHLGSSESRKILEQKFIFQILTLHPQSIKQTLFIQLIYSCFSHYNIQFLHVNKHTHNTHNSSIRSDKGLTLKCPHCNSLWWPIYINSVDNTRLHCRYTFTALFLSNPFSHSQTWSQQVNCFMC